MMKKQEQEPILVEKQGNDWPDICIDPYYERGWHLVDAAATPGGFTGIIHTSPSGSGGADYTYKKLGRPLTDAEYQEIMDTDDEDWEEGMGPPCIHIIEGGADERARNWWDQEEEAS